MELLQNLCTNPGKLLLDIYYLVCFLCVCVCAWCGSVYIPRYIYKI